MNELLRLIESARNTLLELSEHEAFADDAPEFNKGGIGYEMCKELRAALVSHKILPYGRS